MTSEHNPSARQDLLESSHWRPLRLMLDAMDAEIGALYADADHAGIRTRYVGPLIKLSKRGSMTIQELADAVEVTHSAMSQTVAAMRKAGLVEASGGAGDARTRTVTLTRAAEEVLPFLRAEWRATEAAVIELESELPYPLLDVVRDIERALQGRSFRERLRTHFQAFLAEEGGHGESAGSS